MKSQPTLLNSFTSLFINTSAQAAANAPQESQPAMPLLVENINEELNSEAELATQDTTQNRSPTLELPGPVLSTPIEVAMVRQVIPPVVVEDPRPSTLQKCSICFDDFSITSRNTTTLHRTCKFHNSCLGKHVQHGKRRICPNDRKPF